MAEIRWFGTALLARMALASKFRRMAVLLGSVMWLLLAKRDRLQGPNRQPPQSQTTTPFSVSEAAGAAQGHANTAEACGFNAWHQIENNP